jgi:hypothetical protein
MTCFKEILLRFYLQQYGTSSFSLWYLTQVMQSLWRGQSFFGHGQLGADIKGMRDHAII